MADMISIEFQNKLEFLARLDLLETQIDEAVQRTAQFFALTGRTEIQRNLYPSHGYKTGHLRSSYQGEIIERSKCFARIKLWTEVSYAPPLEYMQGGKYAHFRPGIQVASQKAEIYFKEQIGGVLK